MRKKLLASLIGILMSFASFAIVDTVYHENFDAPSGPDSVTTYNSNSTLTSHWNDTTFLAVSPSKSYHTRIVPFDSVIFETNSFSTIGNIFVRLTFNQICKIHFGQHGYIQASNDGGATWQNLDSAMYKGSSPQFAATEYFNELSYPAQSQVPFWSGPTVSASAIVAPTNLWWAKETFDISTILGGANGYANCKIRFIAKHQINVPISLSGWYVDNLLVEAAPCELEPPTFTYDVIPKRKPVGARYTPTQDLNLKAFDISTGIDSVLVHWRLNNGSWTFGKMTPASAGNCPDSSEYTWTWQNIALYDTIDWYVEIYDCACPNMTRDPLFTNVPQNYYRFWRADAPPLICGSAQPGSFPLVVSTYPYFEDFESNYWVPGTGTGATGTTHRGSFPTENTPNGLSWKTSPNETTPGFAWCVRANGGTSTSNTGPDGNNTPNGTKYLYTEASQGNGASVIQSASLLTPCIDLRSLSCAAMEFYVHMYGANIDRLLIDVDTGTASSSFTPVYYKIVGQQQTSSSAPYKKIFVSLDPFVGKIIRIRFIGRKNTSTTQDKNDVAIDDIRIFEPTPIDVEMMSYNEPLNGYCSYSNAEDVKGKLQSLGCQNSTAIPVAFKIVHTPAGSTTPNPAIIKRDTLNGNFYLGKDTTFTFGPKADLSSFGNYKIWIFSEMPGDTIHTNDTIGSYSIDHVAPLSTFPHILDFDGSTTISGNGGTNGGTTGTSVWSRIPPPATSTYAFYVMDGKTPSAATGPRMDYSKKGKYIYAEGNFGTSPANAVFQSECISLVGLTNPVIDFMYHGFGADVNSIGLQVVKSGENTWTQIPGAAVGGVGAFQTASTQQWLYKQVDLSAYAGTVVKIRFIALKTGAGNAADIGLDNIRIYDKKTTDVGVIDITQPKQRVDTTALVAPRFVIRNFGTAAVSNIPITYTITPLCGANAGVSTTYNVTYSGPLAAGQEFEYIVPNSSMPNYPIGDFELCASTTKSGDAYSFNDSYCIKSTGWPIYYIQNGFSEDFDNCNVGNSKGFWRTGDYWTFDLTNNQNFSSSPNAFESLSFPYTSYSNSNEYLFPPRFKGFDTIVGAELWFSHKFNFGTSGGDVGIVEYLTVGGWLPLGFNDPDDQIGINWYNGANLPGASNGDGFVNNSNALPGATNGWITSKWPLNIYNMSTNELVLRFNQQNNGGGSVGWGIDNIEIRIPPQNSASPYAFDTKELFVMPGQTATIQVRLQNTGAKKLDTCMVSYKIDNGPWTTPEQVVFKDPLFSGQLSKAYLSQPNNTSPYYDFNQLWTNPTSGTHTICIVTSRPNNKQDNFTVDDTLCGTIKVFDEVAVNTGNPSYCNNFDDPTQNEWVELNTANKSGLVSWEKGTPNQAPIIGAHSAPNAWMTKLNTNYKTRDSSSLFTPVFVVDSGDVFKLSFWHNFKTEKYHDGGTIDVTFDGGKTWRNVGYVKPDSSWYTTNYVTALDVLNPGWTGESDSWEKDSLNIQFDKDRKFVLRFRFASDQSFEYQGWAIDDFCINMTTDQADDFIGVEELDNTKAINVGNIIPNPSNGHTRIPYFMENPSDVNVRIYSMIGQEMLTLKNISESGINNIEFDVTGWAPGMYIVTLEVNGEQVTRKMVVN